MKAEEAEEVFSAAPFADRETGTFLGREREREKKYLSPIELLTGAEYCCCQYMVVITRRHSKVPGGTSLKRKVWTENSDT